MGDVRLHISYVILLLKSYAVCHSRVIAAACVLWWAWLIELSFCISCTGL